MNILRLGQHEPAQKLQRTIAETCRVLTETPGMDEALYGARDDYVRLLETSFMPNVSSDGVVSVPAAYRGSDALAVVTLSASEKFRLDGTFTVLPPTQKQNAIAYIAERSQDEASPEEAEMLLDTAKPDPGTARMLGKHFVAQVSYRSVALPTNSSEAESPDDVFILGRPLMVIRYSRPYLPFSWDGHSPATVVHEETHVFQAQQQPARRRDEVDEQKTRRELGSYHEEAQVERTRMAADSTYQPPDLQCIVIDEMRERHVSPEDPLGLTDAGKVAFFHAGLDLAIGSKLPPDTEMAHKLKKHRRLYGGSFGALRIMMDHYGEGGM